MAEDEPLLYYLTLALALANFISFASWDLRFLKMVGHYQMRVRTANMSEDQIRRMICNFNIKVLGLLVLFFLAIMRVMFSKFYYYGLGVFAGCLLPQILHNIFLDPPFLPDFINLIVTLASKMVLLVLSLIDFIDVFQMFPIQYYNV